MKIYEKLTTPQRHGSLTPADRIARALGWFAIGLGVTELVAPGRIARALGLQGKETLLRTYGLREIGTGIGSLSIRPAPALWARVGGDALDLATLALGVKGNRRQRRNAMAAMAAVAGVGALDMICATATARETRRGRTVRDYTSRSGFPGAPSQMRGAAVGAAHRIGAEELSPATPAF